MKTSSSFSNSCIASAQKTTIKDRQKRSFFVVNYSNLRMLFKTYNASNQTKSCHSYLIALMHHCNFLNGRLYTVYVTHRKIQNGNEDISE